MNDSLRTDVFVRYAPETIAAACIYLSARKLKAPLPKNPSWFDVLGVEEDDIKDCCYRIMCLYDKKKPNHDELERKVDDLRRKMEESKKLKSTAPSTVHTPSNSSPASRTASPANGTSTNHERNRDHRDKDIREMKPAKKETREGYQMNANSFGGERRSGGGSNRHSSNHHDNRKSYQNRFQSISASHGNGTAVGENIIGAGVNDENTNDRNNMETGRTHENRRGIDRDHRSRENHDKANDLEPGEYENNQDMSRKHKKHKRSRSHSEGEDHQVRRDRKKGKQKRRGGAESPEDLSPSKKTKRHSREKSRYDEKGGHHPDYYDRRVGREQAEGITNTSMNNSRSDDNRGVCYPASENIYYGEDKRDRGGSGYSSTNDQRNSGSYKQRDREYYRR